MIRPRALSVALAVASCCLLLVSCALSSVSAQAGGAVGTPFQSNAFLASLVLTPGTFLPATFNASETAYTLLLGAYNDRVRVQTSLQAQSVEGGASHLFSLNGGDLFYRAAPSDFELSSYGPILTGVNTFKIVCFAKDSTTRIDYQVLIYRPALIASDNADLLGVSFSAGAVTPAIFSARTLNYNLYIASSVDLKTLDVTTTAADANAYLQLIVGTRNAVTVTSGVARQVAMDATIQTIKINSIAQSARKSILYTYNIIRSGALQLTSTGCDPNPPQQPPQGGSTPGGGSTPDDGGSMPDDAGSTADDGGDGGSLPDDAASSGGDGGDGGAVDAGSSGSDAQSSLLASSTGASLVDDLATAADSAAPSAKHLSLVPLAWIVATALAAAVQHM